MSAYTRKLLLAAVVSLLGIGASYGWYALTDGGKGLSSSKVLARLEFEKNEVQKRSVKRVIWQRIDEGEELHSGEAVRTSGDAEAKITFNSGAEVDLDPDSVVVIEDSGDKVNLDFLKGNLLVKGDKSSDLALKSGDTSIAVNDSDMSLGKGAGSNVDVQVLRGVAEMSAGNKKMTLDENNHGTIGDSGVDVAQKFFKSLTPAVSEKVFIHSGGNMQFTWDGVPADYQIQLETGSSRDNMKPLGAPVSGNKGVITASIKPGTIYWHLVAISKKDPKDSHSSLINKAVIIVDVAPTLLAPNPDQPVVLSSKTQTVDLRWANPSKLDKLQIEIAHDPQFKKDIVNEFVDDTGFYSFTKKEEGDYYWRVAGRRSSAVASPVATARPPSGPALVSQPRKFSLKTQFDLTSPEMKFPKAGAHIPYEAANGGSSFFVWQGQPGVGHYHIRVEDVKSVAGAAAIFDKEISEVNQIKMPKLNPGNYRWVVTAQDDEGKESKAPVPRLFAVEEVPTLPWANVEQQETYYYTSEAPSLKPDWKKDSPVVYKHFRVKVTSDAGMEKVAETDVINPLVVVPADGLYHVVVEALDGKGVTVARTSSKDFFVTMKPLLPAPNFEDRTPASIQAQNNGSVSVGWKTVSGAKAYGIQIKDASGKVVKKEQFTNVSGVLKDLLPGQYKVSLSTIDQFGRNGPLGEEKGLVVPDVSDSKPPALKKIQIK